MEKSWKQRHLLYFKSRYSNTYERWKNLKVMDDRRDFCNTYEKILQGINSLPDDPNNYVAVAMHSALSEDYKNMDGIMYEFKNR